MTYPGGWGVFTNTPLSLIKPTIIPPKKIPLFPSYIPLTAKQPYEMTVVEGMCECIESIPSSDIYWARLLKFWQYLLGCQVVGYRNFEKLLCLILLGSRVLGLNS